MQRFTRFFRTTNHLLVGATVVLALGIVIGFLLPHSPVVNAADAVSLTLDQNTQYAFIRPLLGVTIPKSDGQTLLSPITTSVKSIASQTHDDSLTRYSYYYRDLTTGLWTGINESDQYDPASMLKIVVAVAVYKQEELKPGFLSRELTYTQDLANVNASFPYAPAVALQVGRSYSVPFLLKEMLSDSDNAAKDLLLSSVDQSVIDNVYTDLSIPKPNDNNSAGYTISPQDYSRFLRILYYGIYDLSWQSSNNILELLNNATFTSGLVAGVPATVPIAHKYGQHVIGSGSTVNGVELSDCGIVYHPAHPYLICVMTEGKDPLQLTNFIAQVSRATYDAVNSIYRN